MPSHIVKLNRGIKNKGLHFCSNMRVNLVGSGGIIPDYILSQLGKRVSGTTTEWLGNARAWLEKVDNNLSTYWALVEDGGGKYILYAYVGNTFFAALKGTTAFSTARTARANGFILDFANEIIAVGTRYIGRTITTTLDGAVGQGDNTIDVIDASDFPSSGEMFISDGANSETISYTGKTSNQLTGVTKGLYNTTDRAHGSGNTVFGLNDQWKDLGASGVGGQAIRFQDYILVANEPYIAGWASVDGSDFDASLTSFEIPAEYNIKDMSLIGTGAGERILIGADKDKSGALIVWDGVDADWDRLIFLDEKVLRLNENMVGLASGIYYTDGYDIAPFAQLPDDEGDVKAASLDIADMQKKYPFLLISNNSNKLNRNKSGLWLLNIETKEWFYIRPSTLGDYNLTFGAILVNSSWGVYISNDYDGGAVDSLSSGCPVRGAVARFLYDPNSTRVLRLSNIKVGLDMKIKDWFNDVDYGFDIIVRYYDFSKVFLQYGDISGASGSANEIKLTDNFGLPSVGDRIEVIQREFSTHADVAGAIRNITAVSTSAGVHTCTLDEDLPATIDANSANDLVTIIPLQKIEKKSFTGRTINFKDLSFEVSGHPEFKKLLIEVEIRNDSTTHIAPGISYVEITSSPSNR